ncbi:MAG: type II toxin-antitoxin system VapC family toxin [Chloroflexi bacterium]|nr:type II toxin-antitoxin system VapC family toxin [Chloroflexota bacterium]
MGLKYLLDANILSEPMKPRPNERVQDSLRQKWKETAVPAIVWHELLYGLHRLPDSKRKRAIADYLYTVVQNELEILPCDKLAAEWLAEERARLTQIGRPPPYADAQIAAIAVSNDLTLVTRNTKDFLQFDNLMVENWFDGNVPDN